MKYSLIGRNDYFMPIETILNNREITMDLFNLDKSVVEDYHNYDNMQNGIELLLGHLKDEDKIEIVGDCDVDGATSCATIYLRIKEIYPKANLNILIHEGKYHGLSKDIHISDDTKLVILPDASSNDHEEHEKLYKRGIDILVIDHHNCDIGYSKYATVINNQLSDNVKNKELCGAGVVMKFIKALDDYLFEDKSSYYNDLCCLGNVADMMNLKSEETRYYVYQGLVNINNLFLKALIESNKFDLDGKYNIEKIGWVIAPKLNGTIRSGTQEEKMKMYKAFVSDDYEFCLETANMCKNIKTRQDNAVKSAMNNILKTLKLNNNDKCLILEVGKKLNQSHTGLVAQKLSDKFGIPTLLYRDVEGKEGYVGGSFRGINNITKDLRNDLLKSKLVEYGEGHPNAGGWSAKSENIIKLKDYLNELYKEKEIITSKEYQVDFILQEQDIDDYIVNQLASLENEFGNGISTPLIAFENIELYLDDNNSKGRNNIVFYINNIKFIKKFASKVLKEELYNKNIKLNIIGKCSIDTYNNTGQIEVVDMEVAQ